MPRVGLFLAVAVAFLCQSCTCGQQGSRAEDDDAGPGNRLTAVRRLQKDSTATRTRTRIHTLYRSYKVPHLHPHSSFLLCTVYRGGAMPAARSALGAWDADSSSL